MARLADKQGREIRLRAVHANAGIRAAYNKRLQSLIRAMHDSYLWWLRAQYRETPPRMAQDATPAKELERAIKKLGLRWQKQFDEAAPKLAEYFAKAASKRTDAALKSILKKAGFTVEFRMTAAMRDVVQATVAQNVSLIKSIASEYHTEVEGLVMRSVTEGRDLSGLTKELEKRYGITRRRAEFISLDQNNKASSQLRRVRELELGIDDGIWLHSGGGRHPRPSHVRQSGRKFSIRDGWPDPALKGKRIWPGTEPRCRCTWKPVIRGFS